MDTYVTDVFVERAKEHNLQGMEFRKVWPLPRGVDWRILAYKDRTKREAKGLPRGKTVKGNTVVIHLRLSGKATKLTPAERKGVNKLMDELDALLVDADSRAPAVGSVEGFDTCVPGRCRLF